MNRITAVVAGLSLAFVGTSATFAGTIYVPGDQPTIAAAISASVNGDVINIAAGTYNEYNLNPGGKAITIQGSLNGDGSLATTIDGQQSGSVFVINSGEENGTVIKDLVITGGSGTEININGTLQMRGGGISCLSSFLTITGCTFTGNTAEAGGGIDCVGGGPTISGCTISDNTASIIGGGVSLFGSYPTISDCTISGNTACGIYCFQSSNATISDCEITDNVGGGIQIRFSNPTITDCTVSGNNGSGITSIINSSPIIRGGKVCGNHPDQLSGTFPFGVPNPVIAPTCPGTPGDMDNDGDVDTNDLNALHVALGINNTDVNNNGCVDIDDLLYVIEDWNEGCTP